METNEVYNKSKPTGVMNEQEKKAFNSYALCENRGHCLTISKKENSDKLIVFHCEYKSEEAVYKWSPEDILNMSASEFLTNMREGYRNPPPNHDYNVYDFCKANVKKCIKPGELDKVCVNISTACNIKCKFCNIKELKKPFPKEKELYFNVLNKLKNAGLNELQLTGDGEPFVYKEDTLNFIDNININDCKHLSIFTNATLLNKEDIIRINEASNRTGVKITIMCSCSAITPETYKIAHGNENFVKVVENIKLISDLNMLSCVNFVVMPDNLHELEFYKQYWHEKNVTNLATTVIHDYCYPGARDFVYNSEEFKRYLANS